MRPPVPRCLDELVEWLRARFDAKAATDLFAVVHLDLEGPDGGSVVLRIEPGRAEVGRGAVTEPDLRLRAAAADVFSILSGCESADVLHMEGRLELDGDLGLAMKLRTIFPA